MIGLGAAALATTAMYTAGGVVAMLQSTSAILMTTNAAAPIKRLQYRYQSDCRRTHSMNRTNPERHNLRELWTVRMFRMVILFLSRVQRRVWPSLAKQNYVSKFIYPGRYLFIHLLGRSSVFTFNYIEL